MLFLFIYFGFRATSSGTQRILLVLCSGTIRQVLGDHMGVRDGIWIGHMPGKYPSYHTIFSAQGYFNFIYLNCIFLDRLQLFRSNLKYGD